MTFLTRRGLPNQSYNTKGKKGGKNVCHNKVQYLEKVMNLEATRIDGSMLLLTS